MGLTCKGDSLVNFKNILMGLGIVIFLISKTAVFIPSEIFIFSE